MKITTQHPANLTRKIALLLSVILWLGLSAVHAQQVAYASATPNVTLSTSSNVQCLSYTITLTKTGAVSFVSNLYFTGTQSGVITIRGQIYVDGTAISSAYVSNWVTTSTLNGPTLPISGRITGLAAGTHTIQLFAQETYLQGSDLTCLTASSLSILEDEDSSALTAQVAAITSAYQLADTQLQALIDALTTRVTTLESSMTTAQGDITTLQGQVSTLQSQMSTANANIASNTAEIASLKSQIGSLQTRLDSLKQQNDDLAKSGIGLGSAGIISLFGYGSIDGSPSAQDSTQRMRQILSK